jgi:hypothetical protein
MRKLLKLEAPKSQRKDKEAKHKRPTTTGHSYTLLSTETNPAKKTRKVGPRVFILMQILKCNSIALSISRSFYFLTLNF